MFSLRFESASRERSKRRWQSFRSQFFGSCLCTTSGSGSLLLKKANLGYFCEDLCPSFPQGETFWGYFNLQLEEADPADILPALESPTPSSSNNCNIPKPPSPPVKTFTRSNHARLPDCSSVPKETKHTWDSLFVDGYGADVYIFMEENSFIVAHSSILSAASPVLRNIMHQSTVRNGMRYIRIPGVPNEAVQAFIRFLYSSCYEEETMKKYVLHLLILSHSYSVPSLKRVCTHYLEYHWLTKENVVDVLQLARYCDAPRLSLFCVRMVLKDFKSISLTEGWKVMKRANPALEQELLEAVVEVDSGSDFTFINMTTRLIPGRSVITPPL